MSISIIYIVYLIIAAIIVFVVGYLFYHYGAVYMHVIFPQQTDVARMVNGLILIGYYLLNLGFILYFLKKVQHFSNWNEAIFFIADQLSNTVLIIALMHYNNIICLRYISKRFFSQTKNNTI